jgi:hypothetical protein
MAGKPQDDGKVFLVDSHFQKMARRTGGVTRDQAMENAQMAIDKIKMGFGDWLEGELEPLLAQLRKGSSASAGDVTWAETAIIHARQIRDVGTTMGFELVTFITNNLCEILEAIIAGAPHRNEMIDCHVDALLLAKQEQYRHLRPEQLPELSSGLRRVLEAANSPASGTLKE